MPENVKQQLKFPINQWKHLYSLEQAVKHAVDDTGRRLMIDGSCPSVAFFDNQKLLFELTLVNVADYPDYRQTSTGDRVLSELTLSLNDEGEALLSGEMQLDNQVFEELRKNILEYSLIDGIFIEMQLTVLWPDNITTPADVTNNNIDMLSLHYAMRS